MVSRGTFEGANDDPMMSEVDVNLSHGEKSQKVEFMQPYGLSTVPVGPRANGSAKGRAEVVMVHADGSRSHPLAIMVADRRYRPKGMQPGEVQLHDDQGQQVHLTRNGLVVSSPKSLTFKVGDAGSITIGADGVITLRGSAIKFEQG